MRHSRNRLKQSRVPRPRSRLAATGTARAPSVPEVARRVGTHTLPDFDLLQVWSLKAVRAGPRLSRPFIEALRAPTVTLLGESDTACGRLFQRYVGATQALLLHFAISTLYSASPWL